MPVTEHADGQHAGGLTWQEMTVGSRHLTAGRTVNDVDIINFVNNAGFSEPLFLDMEYLARSTPYESRVAPGLLGVSLIAQSR